MNAELVMQRHSQSLRVGQLSNFTFYEGEPKSNLNWEHPIDWDVIHMQFS